MDKAEPLRESSVAPACLESRKAGSHDGIETDIPNDSQNLAPGVK
jgi:hypothetical protein